MPDGFDNGLYYFGNDGLRPEIPGRMQIAASNPLDYDWHQMLAYNAPETSRFVDEIVTPLALMGADNAPGWGDLMSAASAVSDAKKGNYISALVNALGAAPLIPGLGILKKLPNDLSSESGYLYHATNAERAADIAEQGLIPHNPWDFTEQEMWPDEGINPRSYFSRRADIISSFAPEEGLPVAIRVKDDPTIFNNERYTGDVYTNQILPPEKIEGLEESGRWMPLKQAITDLPMDEARRIIDDRGGLIEKKHGAVDWEVMEDYKIDADGNESPGDPYVRINNLYVSPENRGQGLARDLMNEAISEIRKRYGNIDIRVVPEPKESQVDFDRLSKFYEDLGLDVVAY